MTGKTTQQKSEREKNALCNNFPRNKADAQVKIYKFLWCEAKGQRELQQERAGLEILATTSKDLLQTLELISVTTKINSFDISSILSVVDNEKRNIRTIPC